MSDETSRWRASKDKDGNLTWEAVKPYNLEKALREYDPTKRGRVYGADNPIQEDKSLTHVESEMLAGVRNHITSDLQDWHIQCSGQIRSELNEVGEGVDSSRQFEKSLNSLSSTARGLETTFLSNHEKTIEEENKKRRALVRFKYDNGLDRDARYPESKTLHLAVLFLVLAIEGAFNAFFFSDNPLGLLGGFGKAIMIAGVNVGICFVVGRYLATQLNLKSWTVQKWAGLILLMICIPLVITFHLSVAHWREALQQSADVDYFVSLAFDPRTLEDMQSLVLIGLGLLTSVIAGIDGYTYEDPYPGYGTIYRDWKSLSDMVHEQTMTYKLAVNDAYNKAVNEIGEIPNHYAATEKLLKKFDGDIDTYFACVERYYDQAKGAAHALITTFRKEVEAVWESPRSFPVSDDLVDSALPSLDPAGLKNEVQKQLEEFFTSLRDSRNGYKEEKTQYMRELETEREKWIGAANVKEMIDAMKIRIEDRNNADKGYLASGDGDSRGWPPATVDATKDA